MWNGYALFLVMTSLVFVASCLSATKPVPQNSALQKAELSLDVRSSSLSPTPEVSKPKLEARTIPEPLTLIVYETKSCKTCKEIHEDLKELNRIAKGQFEVRRVDASRLEVLKEYNVKPLFPAFVLVGGELDEVIRKYGLSQFEDVKAWLMAGDARPYRVPLAQNTLKVSTPSAAILVAGSSDNANFAQEVLWLKEILQSKGVGEDEISCFYAMPDAVGYYVDREQFDELSPSLKSCRPALRDSIVENLRASLDAKPQNLFFYATAHGHPPDKPLNKEEEECLARAPSLVLDEGKVDCDRDNHLTPDSLASAIPEWNETNKVFVFQGCYTGGFISARDNPNRYPSELAKQANMTLFTASRPDRPSFGCAPGTVSTLFGGSFVKAFLNDKASLGETNWAAIMKKTRKDVRQLEKEWEIKERSDPRFFQSYPTKL